MKTKSLIFKILSLIIAGGLISCVAILFVAESQIKKIVNEQQRIVYNEKLTDIMNILKKNNEKLKATGMENSYIEDFQNLSLDTLRSLHYKGNNHRIYPFIFNGDGEIVLHPVLLPGDGSLANSPEFKQIIQLKNGEFNSIGTQKKISWFVFKKFEDWGWYVVYDVPLDLKFAGMKQLMRHIAMIMSFIGLIAVFLVSILITKVLKPIRDLTEASHAMALGNLNHLIDIKQRDELGILARSFTMMRTAIHEKMNALSQSEKRFRLLFNNVGHAVFLHNADGQVLDVNKAMTDMYDVTREEALSMNILTHFTGPGNPVEALPDIWHRVLGGLSMTFEWNAKQPHHDYCFPVEVSLNSVTFEGETQVLATVRNLSLQREAEAQLVKEKSFTEALLNTLPGAFYVYNEDMQLIRWNKNFEQEAGLSPEEMLHKHPLDWFQEKQKPLIKRALQRIFDEGFASVESELILKNGPVSYYLTGTLLDVDGKQYILGVGVDISKRLELEEELAQSQKMEAIGTLAGGIAHDFNNILTAIFGYSELIKMTAESDSVQHHIDAVITAADRAKDLIKQILTFSRKTPHEKQPLALAQILSETFKLLRASIPTTIEIKQSIESHAIIFADPTKVHQVIMNLCTNAYQAMRNTGGTLALSLTDVTIEEWSRDQIDREAPCGRYVALEVSDTGSGMDEETKSKIFEPYFTTKKVGEGTGLGLSVVYGIITDHNGFIHVYSEPGQGTSFRVYFPVMDEPADAVRIQNQDEAETLGGNEVIMVVDDEEVIVDLLVNVLSRCGYQVKAFHSSDQAFQAFSHDPDHIDLVISDMTMPVMTGTDLTREIHGLRPQMPIILMSGISEMLNKDALLALGVRGFCEKPLKIKPFLQLVRKALDQ